MLIVWVRAATRAPCGLSLRPPPSSSVPNLPRTRKGKARQRAGKPCRSRSRRPCYKWMRAPEFSRFSSSVHVFFLLCMAPALFCLDSLLGVSSNYLNCLHDYSKLPFLSSSSFAPLEVYFPSMTAAGTGTRCCPQTSFFSGGGEGTQHSLYISMVEVYDMV